MHHSKDKYELKSFFLSLQVIKICKQAALMEWHICDQLTIIKLCSGFEEKS